MEKPPPEPDLLVSRSDRVPSGSMLVAGFWLLRVSITDIFYKPGIANILTPIRLRRTMERIMNMRPETAELMISLP